MKGFARGRRRHVPGEMNKLEREYGLWLTAQQNAGKVQHHEFEAVKLKLAPKTYLTPDFFVLDADGLVEFHEVKGFWEDDARVKIKVAAERFWWARFVAVTFDRKTGWQFETFGGEEQAA